MCFLYDLIREIKYITVRIPSHTKKYLVYTKKMQA